MAMELDEPQQEYRILHSSGVHVATDRATALARLGDLPGAKLFVIETTTPSTKEAGPPPRRSSSAPAERTASPR